MNLQPTLQNEHIRMQPLSEKDFDALYAVASDPLIWEQHPSPDRYKEEVFRLYFDGAVTSQSAFLVFDKRTGILIGSTRYYAYEPEASHISIGYTFLAREYWGGKYNRAMKSLLLNHAFQFVTAVRFHIGATNLRSQRAVLKLGADKINELEFGPAGKQTLHFEYEIKKENWIQFCKSQNTN